MPEELIIVDPRNRPIGTVDKYAAHRRGLLHRAFSIFLVDPEGRVLLQQRHPAKYHSGGLWANSCCGHPRPGEKTAQAARRRVEEEVGVGVPLTFGFRTRYFTTFPNGLIENEIVHVLFGPAPETLAPNRREVVAVAWTDLGKLQRDAARHPNRFAFWLRFYLDSHFPELLANVSAMRRRYRERAPIYGKSGIKP